MSSHRAFAGAGGARSAGRDRLCIAGSRSEPYFRVGGAETFALGGIGSFSQEILLAEDAAIPIDRDVPWEVAALLGCGVTTGVGAVLNAARLEPRSSVVVIGCGGVGTSVIQGARLAGAAEIVAVDRVAEQREQARRFGATDVASLDDLPALQARLTGDAGGFDYGFEAVGAPETIRATYDAVRRGGTAVIVGVGQTSQQVTFDAFELSHGDKTLRGTWFGSRDPRLEFGRVLHLWKTGRLDLEAMITHRGHLDDVNDAFDEIKAGRGVVRTVLTV